MPIEVVIAACALDNLHAKYMVVQYRYPMHQLLLLTLNGLAPALSLLLDQYLNRDR